MRTSTLVLFFLVLAAVPYAVSAYSMQEVNSLLARYNVSSPIISGLTTVNLTYNGTVYVGLYDGSGALDFLVNTSGQYFFVLNDTTAYSIIKNYTQDTAFSQANFAGLASQMHKYQNTSAGVINDCLVETGLSAGATCTPDNFCESCQYIPNCKKVLDATHGATGIFGTGITDFEIANDNLNTDYNAFYTAIDTISRSNVLLNLVQINSSFLGISNVTQNMYKNPIFPPTADVTPNVLAHCSDYASQSSSPWYCTSLGYCFNLNFNYTKLTVMSSALQQITALPLSNAKVLAIAQNAVSNEMTYAYPILSHQKLTELYALINSTLPNYAALVNNTSLLLSHVSNPALSAGLSSLVASYDGVVADYFTANLTSVGMILSSEYANLSSAYSALNASYSAILSVSRNNTAKLIELQVSKQGISGELLSLAFSQLALNTAIAAGSVANLTSLGMQLANVSSKLSAYSTSPMSLVELARSVDGPFIRGFSKTLGLSYSNAVGLAPIIGSILPLLVGIVVLVLLMVFRSYLKMKRKLVENPRTANNWRNIYRVVALLTILWIIATYALLSYANSSAPFSAFKSAYASSQYLAIAINGTPTLGSSACASRISADALALNKTAVLIRFMNGQCTINSSTMSVDACMDFYASTNIPVVVLSLNTRNTMSLYSLYGTVLGASGNNTVMNLCYVSLLTS